jgi:transposase
MKTENFSNDQLVKAQILARAILRISGKGESIESVFNSLNITYKPKTYYVLKKKYEKDGLSGLLPQTYKCGCKSLTLQNEVRSFIRGVKQKHPDITGKEIQKKILKKFKLEYTVSNINLIIKKLNISVEQGRPTKKKEIDMSYAGSFILQAAIMDTHFIDQLISVQKDIMNFLEEGDRTVVNSKSSVHSGVNGIREEKGIFSKDIKGKFRTYEKENKEDYASNGFVSNKFKSVKNRVPTRDLNRLSILGVRPSTLYRKNMTLLFLPVLTSHGRAIEIITSYY